MGVYLRTKLQVSSMILSFRQGVILPPSPNPPSQNEPLKSRPRLGLNIISLLKEEAFLLAFL